MLRQKKEQDLTIALFLSHYTNKTTCYNMISDMRKKIFNKKNKLNKLN